jgi:hypothetical protein
MSNRVCLEPSPDNLRNKEVGRFIQSQLKTSLCLHYEFSHRHVFTKKEFNNANDMLYGWPAGHIHTKARDPHPDLNERFSVPDEFVIINPKVPYPMYNPNFAMTGNIESSDRNPAGRYVYINRMRAVRLKLNRSTVDSTFFFLSWKLIFN